MSGNFHDRLTALLQARGWSLRELARRLDAPVSTVHRWVRDGHPQQEYMTKLCQLFSVSEAYLRHGLVAEESDDSTELLRDIRALTDDQRALIEGTVRSMLRKK